MKNIKFILLFTLSLTVQFVLAQQKETKKPFVLGETIELQSKILGEKRVLNIYLPEGYNPKNSVKYPVIYLLDGSADEDFIHIAGLVQFYSTEWIRQVPKSIIIGIGTVDRRRDFTFPTKMESDQKKYPTTGHSDQFIAFLAKELQPYIQKNYQTNQSKTIIGQSLGGLLATEILFKQPNLFNTYIIVSPSLWWDNGSLLHQPMANLSNINIYIAVGKEGLTPTAIPRVMEVDANLLAEQLNNRKATNVKVYFDYLPQENHATILHQAVANSFKFVYPTLPAQ